ncbi:MAG: hypothetical protein RR478_03310 [Bacilli bacterium]
MKLISEKTFQKEMIEKETLKLEIEYLSNQNKLLESQVSIFNIDNKEKNSRIEKQNNAIVGFKEEKEYYINKIYKLESEINTLKKIVTTLKRKITLLSKNKSLVFTDKKDEFDKNLIYDSLTKKGVENE